MEGIILRLKATFKTDLVKKAVNMLNEAFSDINPKIMFCVVEQGREFDFEVKFVSREKMALLAGKDALGYCDDFNRRIYILYDSLNDESTMLSTLMHELLHALGLSHIPEFHSLMYEEDTGVRGVTIHDIKALVRHLQLRRTLGGVETR